MTFADNAVRLELWSRLNALDIVDNEVILVELSLDMFRADSFFRENNVVEAFILEVDAQRSGQLGNLCWQQNSIVKSANRPCPIDNSALLKNSSETEVPRSKSGADA